MPGLLNWVRASRQRKRELMASLRLRLVRGVWVAAWLYRRTPAPNIAHSAA
jgi:hypothetical protein